MKDQHEDSDVNYILVDGANVAYTNKTTEGKPQLKNIRLVTEKLEKEGYYPIVIADATLWHEIDKPDKMDELVESGKIRQSPAGTEADYFLIQTAEKFNAKIISNDQFGKYTDAHPDVYDRRVPFMIIKDTVEFHGLND